MKKTKLINSRKETIVFINDDADDRKQWLEWAKRNNYTAKAVESVLEAKDIRADYYVFDISAVAPGITNAHMAYSPICKIIELHPGATIIIVSAVGKTAALDVIDEVESRIGVRPIYGGWGTFKDFEKAIFTLKDC